MMDDEPWLEAYMNEIALREIEHRDESHCDHGTPEMVRGMWFHECMCIEKPVRERAP